VLLIARFLKLSVKYGTVLLYCVSALSPTGIKPLLYKELVGGGLLSNSGGFGVIKTMSKSRIHLKGDERILGNSDFVKEVLAE